MARSTRGRARPALEFWPGFVDALATLLIVIVFLVMVFVLAQFFMGQAISGRDQQLKQLSEQLTLITDQLGHEKTTGAELRARLATLTGDLQQAQSDRDRAQALLASITAERDQLTKQISESGSRLAVAAGEIQRLVRELDDTRVALGAEKAALEARGAEPDAKTELENLRQLRNDLDARLAAAQSAVRERDAALTQTRERSRDLETRLAQAEERLASTAREAAQRDIKLAELQARVEQAATEVEAERKIAQQRQGERDDRQTLETRVSEAQARAEKAAADLEAERKAGQETRALLNQSLDRERAVAAEIQRLTKAEQAHRDFVDDRGKLTADLERQRSLSADAQAQVELLNEQIAVLRGQLDRIARALAASEERTREQDAQITDLGRRLNVALVAKIEELAHYRSEFFGKLRDLVGDRPDVRVVGDRFVFQSEVLFPPGSADLPATGRAQVATIANALKQIAGQIPDDVNWVLQVNGHTDNTPIRTGRFPSNWELSQARAMAVVRLLIEQGIDPRRLVAAGWGEFQPLEPGDAAEVRQRNRRIELKLTAK